MAAVEGQQRDQVEHADEDVDDDQEAAARRRRRSSAACAPSRTTPTIDDRPVVAAVARRPGRRVGSPGSPVSGVDVAADARRREERGRGRRPSASVDDAGRTRSTLSGTPRPGPTAARSGTSGADAEEARRRSPSLGLRSPSVGVERRRSSPSRSTTSVDRRRPGGPRTVGATSSNVVDRRAVDGDDAVAELRGRPSAPALSADRSIADDRADGPVGRRRRSAAEADEQRRRAARGP